MPEGQKKSGLLIGHLDLDEGGRIDAGIAMVENDLRGGVEDVDEVILFTDLLNCLLVGLYDGLHELLLFLTEALLGELLEAHDTLL